MKSVVNKIITSDLVLTQEVIDFFTAQVTNPAKFQEIISICTEASKKAKKINSDKLIRDGNLSVFDFLMYKKALGLIRENDGIALVNVLIEELVESNILWPLSEPLQVISQDMRYKSVEGPRTMYLYKNQLILNLVCGWSYIIDKYSNSVFKIEHTTKNGDKFMGTAFYILCTDGKQIRPILVTNKHVVDKAKKIRVFDKDDVEHFQKDIKIDSKNDLAYIELKKRLPCISFLLSSQLENLAEIITIGYPSIPMTNYSYQVCHKGEINSEVENHGGSKFLFSAKTSAGNSGSPVINEYGLIVGMVTEELFEEELFYKKGKLPYYAAIPSTEINKFIIEEQIVKIADQIKA